MRRIKRPRLYWHALDGSLLLLSASSKSDMFPSPSRNRVPGSEMALSNGLGNRCSPGAVRFIEKDGARERTRTSTTLRSLAPEASASASSATRARVQVHPDRVGMTLEMLTTAQPESHMQRSIFILPATAPFV